MQIFPKNVYTLGTAYSIIFFYRIVQCENAADRKGPEHIGQRSLGVGSVHAGRDHRRVLQAVEEHRIIRPRAASDRYFAVRHASFTAGPVTVARRR